MANNETISEIIDAKALSQLDDAAAKVALLAKEFNDLLPSVTALNQALGGNQSLAAFNRQLQQVAVAQQRLTQAQQQAAAATARAQQAQNNLANQVARTAQQQQNATARANQASTAYGQLIERQKQLNEAARQAGAAFGVQSQQFQQASQSANAVNGEVAAINRSLGNYRDNVGNYASAFGKAFGAIRTIANILPGIGLSGIFLAAYEAIKYIVTELGLLQNGLTGTQRVANEFKNALTGPEYGDAISSVSRLKENILLAKQGFLDKNDVLKEYNETIGKTTGQVNSLNQAEDELNKKASAYVKFTLLKAVANSALKDAAEKAVESQKAQRETDEDSLSFFDKVLTGYIKVSNYLSGPGAATLIPSNLADNLLGSARRGEIVSKAEKEQKSLLDIFKDFQKQAAEIAKNNNFDFFGGDLTKDKQSNNDALELLKQKLQNAKDAANRIYIDENNTFTERTEALNSFEKRSTEIIKVEQAIRLRENGLSADKIKAIQFESQNQISEIQNDALKKRQTLLNEQQKALQKSIDDQYKTLSDAQKKEVDDLRNAGNDRLTEIARQDKIAKQDLLKQYADGKITSQEYNDKILQIETSSTAKRIEVQIEALKKVADKQKQGLALGLSSPEDINKTNADIAKLEQQKEEYITKIVQDNVKKREDAIKGLHQLELDIALKSIDLIKDIVDKGYQKQIDKLGELSDTIDQNATEEKAALSRSLLSSKQKADKEASIDKQTQSQKEAIADRQKQIQSEEAKTNALIQEAQIIAQTAQAVFDLEAKAASATAQAALLSSNPLTLAYAPVALAAAASITAEIPAVIGLAALQAAAIAIPAFEHGTQHAPGGLSRVSEKGRELVIEPGGKSYLTPQTESIIDLKRGSKVIPAHQVSAMIGKPERIQYVGGQAVDMSELLAEQREGNKALKQIAQKKQSAIIIPNERFAHYRQQRFR